MTNQLGLNPNMTDKKTVCFDTSFLRRKAKDLWRRHISGSARHRRNAARPMPELDAAVRQARDSGLCVNPETGDSVEPRPVVLGLGSTSPPLGATMHRAPVSARLEYFRGGQTLRPDETIPASRAVHLPIRET